MGFAPVYQEKTIEKAHERVEDLVKEGFDRDTIFIYKEDDEYVIGVD